MKTERELFQDFCEKNFDFERHEQTYFDEQTQCYENDIGECTESINMAWSAWQASAQRQSYKIVPCEPTYKQLDALKDSCELFKKAGVSDLEAHRAYKAMIGASK